MTGKDFLEHARSALHQDGFAFDLRSLAAEGSRTGALTPAERVAMESRSQLPIWLREELGLEPQVEPSTAYSTERLEVGRPRVYAPPNLLGDGWLPAPFHATTGTAPDVDLVSGGAARILTANFLNAVMVDDGFVPPLTRADNLWGWQLMQERDPVHLGGHALLLVVEGSSVFTHWVLDTLPRFGALERHGIDLREFDHVVLATRASAFHREALTMLGLDGGRVVTRQEIGPYISVDAFTHVTAVRQGFTADPWVYDFVRDLFVDGQPKPPGRRLYITRAGASRRRLVNEAELLPFLAQAGFEVVRAEDLGLTGMATLCAQATHVIAPHGAGLANIAFMPPGGKVLELYGAHVSPEYWRICQDRDLQYSCLQGRDPSGRRLDQVAVESMGFFERNFLDVVVPVHEFRSALARFLEGDRRSRWRRVGIRRR